MNGGFGFGLPEWSTTNPLDEDDEEFIEEEEEE